jgi:hypothetical protein
VLEVVKGTEWMHHIHTLHSSVVRCTGRVAEDVGEMALAAMQRGPHVGTACPA